MKTLTLSVATVVLLGTLTLGMSADIDTQLTAISNASEADRVELVNNLKTELQAMSPEDRHEVMSLVRSELGSHDGTGAGMGEQTRTQARTQMREHAQNANADGAQQMQGMEHSAQRRMDAGIEMSAQSSHSDGDTSGKMFGRR